MVGDGDHAAAVDLQPEMLDGMLNKAKSAALHNRILPRLCDRNSLHISDLNGKVDFALLFMMLHEVPDQDRLVKEVYDALKPDGKLLFAEPLVHVGKSSFEASMKIMQTIGFTATQPLSISLCRAVLLERMS